METKSLKDVVTVFREYEIWEAYLPIRGIIINFKETMTSKGSPCLLLEIIDDDVSASATIWSDHYGNFRDICKKSYDNGYMLNFAGTLRCETEPQWLNKFHTAKKSTPCTDEVKLNMSVVYVW